MASSKLIVAVFLIYLAAACVAKSLHKTARSETDYIPMAKDVFGSLNRVMSDMINPTTRAPGTALAAITNAARASKASVDKVFDTLNGLINRTKSMQTRTRASAQQEIDQIIADAEAVSLRLGGEPGCVVEHLGKGIALGAQTGLNEIDCPGNKIVELEDMLQTVLTSAQTALTMGPQAEIDLEACYIKGGIMMPVCEGMVALDFSKRVASVATQATGLVAKAVMLATTIEASLPACAALTVTQTGAKAAALVGQFGLCSGKAVASIVPKLP